MLDIRGWPPILARVLGRTVRSDLETVSNYEEEKSSRSGRTRAPARETTRRYLSSTIRAKNQALNENIDNVLIILDQKLDHRSFCVESGFCFGVVDVL